MKEEALKAIESDSADPERARRGFELLRAAIGGAGLVAFDPEQVRIVAALFSGSQALGNLLIAHPEWIKVIAPETVQFPRRLQGLKAEVAAWLPDLLRVADYRDALSRVRELRQREMLRIAARDLARLGNLDEILQEIFWILPMCVSTRHGRFAGINSPPVMALPIMQMLRVDGIRPAGACSAWAN